MNATVGLGADTDPPGVASTSDPPPGGRGPSREPRTASGRAWHAHLPRVLVTEHHLIGASLLRIGLGGVLLAQLLRHWSGRTFLWGPHGVYPLWLFERELPTARAPSFLAVESEPLFHALYILSIAVALLYLVGWQTRWIGIWLYVLTWSLIYRNPMLMTGGEKLLLAMLPYVVLLLNTSAYLSADAGWRRIGDRRPPSGPFVALLHNVGLLCVVAQLAIMYGFSGFAKLLGEPWRDGTAVYYVLRSQEFTLPGVSPLIYQSAVLVPLLTYATLLFELTAPILIWSARTRWLVVLQAVAFHAFIGVFLGLTLFAVQALIFQFLLVDDGRYRSLGSRAGRLWCRARRARLRRSRSTSRSASSG